MNLKVPGAILPLGCAILSTRAKTVRGVGTTPLRRTTVKEYLCKVDNDEAEETSESLWSEYRTILSKTADQVLGKCKRQPKKPWISTTVLMLAEEKSNLRKKGRSPDQEQRYKELRSEIQRRIRKDKADWLEDQCKQIKEFDYHLLPFDTIKAVKNNNLRCIQQACIKDKDGSVLDQKESIMERWKEYGAELSERPDGELPMTENRLPPNEQ